MVPMQNFNTESKRIVDLYSKSYFINEKYKFMKTWFLKSHHFEFSSMRLALFFEGEIEIYKIFIALLTN